MLKAIFFDLDGVITTWKAGTIYTVKYICDILGLDYDELVKIRYDKYAHLEIGDKEIWELLSKDVGVNIDYKLVLNSFKLTPIDSKMVALAKKLKKRYKIGIITDNAVIRVEEILKHNKLDSLFDTVVISGDVGARKNNTKIFEVALENLGVNADKSIFIDNAMKNVEVANSFGMHGIYFDDEVRDYEKLKKEIEEII